MSFADCINTAAKAGKLSSKKQGEALRAFKRAKDEKIAEGMSEEQAEDAAAQAAVKATTTLVYAKRRERIDVMRKHHDLYQRIEAAQAPGGELEKLILETGDIYKATIGEFSKLLDTVLLEFAPRAVGLYTPKENMGAIVDGIYGQATDADVSPMVKAVQAFITHERNLLNLEGASIPENPNFRLWQSHDPILVHAAGKEYWVAKHLEDGVLDWEVMRYAGKEIPVDKRQKVLEDVWESIVTSGKNKETVGQANTESLASRLSRERFLYYKSAESWKTMQKEFGTGDFYHQLVAHMESGARNVSLMRSFGANPSLGKAYVERLVQHKVGLQKIDATSTRSLKKLKARTDSQLRNFDEAYRIHSRDIDTGAGHAVAMVGGTLRGISVNAVLGSAIISNLSDPIFGMWIKGIHGIPQLSTIPRYFSALANYKDMRQQMLDNAIAVESLTNRAWEGNRHAMVEEGHHFIRNVGDVSYRLQGLSAWTNIGRGVSGIQAAQLFARARDLPFEELPFVTLMRTYGVTKEDWDLFRQTPLHEAQYYNFGSSKMLRPIDFVQAANTDAARQSANRMLMFQETIVREGIPTPTNPARAALGGAMPGSAPYTQFFKAGTQLMIFPATMHYQYMRHIFNAPRYRDKLWRLGTFLVYTTVAGAMITQLKDALNGRKFNPMDNKDFWVRAFLNGGAGGILGDFLYDAYGALSGSAYSANTPIGEQYANLKRLTLGNINDYNEGKELHLGADVARTAWGLFPFKAPGIKLVIERTIMDSILEQSDPAAYARKIQAQRQWEQDQGQGTWWGVGESPDLGKLFE